MAGYYDGLLAFLHSSVHSGFMGPWQMDLVDASTEAPALLARLALRTGAPIVPVFADFAPGGGYRVTFAPPVELPAGEGEEAVAELTRRCLALVEAATREAPERWFWLHDRWKGAPER